MYYNSNGNIDISNTELVQYHRKIKSNLYMALSDVLYDSENPLFIVEENELFGMDSMFKVIPLFCCDKIETDSDKVLILNENQALLVWDTFTNYEGFVNFIAYNEVNDIGLHYDILNFHNTKVLSGTVFETENYTNVKNAVIEISYTNHNYKLNSDDYGGFILKLEDYVNQTLTINVTYDNIVKTF